jgi:hypothetical protein
MWKTEELRGFNNEYVGGGYNIQGGEKHVKPID